MSNESNSLTIIENMDIKSVESTTRKINEFQSIVRKNLKEGKDFGTIPGCSKPTLLKPGAEKILMLMGLQSTYEILDSTRDFETGFFQYQVRCTLTRNGMVITQGLGSCNSRERKYVKQDPYSVDNTILKMAKKRSQVDASLTVASLSEIFTQDVEDGGIADDDYNHNSTPKTTAKNTDKATDKQIGLIKKQILESHLMNDEEKKRLEKKVNNGLSKSDASTIISWWLGDSKKGTEGERAIREQQESLEEDVINVEDEGNADFPYGLEQEKVTSKS